MQTSVQTEGMRLTLPAPYTIRHVDRLYDTIREALSTHDKITLDLSSDADPDLSFLQLIEIARHYAAAQDKRFFLDKPVSPQIRERLKVAGLVSQDDRQSGLFWFHDEASQ